MTNGSNAAGEDRPYKRWYDAYSDIQQSVTLLETFPETILEIIARGVVSIAEDEFYAEELMKSVRTLGWDKVSALYKSKQKRRSYDRSPGLHKSMNYLFLMSDDNRKQMGAKMVELVHYVYDYLKVCQQYEHAASKEDIGNLVDTYVADGSLEARRFLKNLSELFKADYENKNTIRAGHQDMRVRVAH